MAEGKRFGRKPKLTEFQRKEDLKRRAAGETLAEIAKLSPVFLASLHAAEPNVGTALLPGRDLSHRVPRFGFASRHRRVHPPPLSRCTVQTSWGVALKKRAASCCPSSPQFRATCLCDRRAVHCSRHRAGHWVAPVCAVVKDGDFERGVDVRRAEPQICGRSRRCRVAGADDEKSRHRVLTRECGVRCNRRGITTSTRNHSWVIRRFLNRRW
jgi:hypothetical protein